MMRLLLNVAEAGGGAFVNLLSVSHDDDEEDMLPRSATEESK
jgi:hypothetical protein